MKCRFCGNALSHVFLDLGTCPLSNAFLSKERLDLPEVYYPLKLFTCDKCFLVQVAEQKAARDIFSGDYIYFSSYSKLWLNHARNYVAMISRRLELNQSSLVIEVASNDGYLLQFVKEKGIPCLGIEPAASTAEVAIAKGIDVVQDFFGTRLALQLRQQNRQADLLLGANVLAHVPDINDFVEGIKIALKPGGTATMEFPHLLQLIEDNQFDTIYHEHFSYLSFQTVLNVFAAHELTLYDVEEMPTHGGSVRVYARHASNQGLRVSPAVDQLLDKEKAHGMHQIEYYCGFQKKVDRVKYDFVSFLIAEKLKGRKIAAYGAAAKGNTLLNYAGLKSDLIDFVADASPHKQGKFLPGSRIPVVSEGWIRSNRPDYIIVFPWNIKNEIIDQLSYVRDWHAKFIIPIPTLEVL
ncbi:MAG: class I SAM-dependent methyltransferase [Elusimicrobia bacterium]|nr:class I SAM-dependent methyltransferase [Elusimicrobiota bacterium]